MAVLKAKAAVASARISVCEGAHQANQLVTRGFTTPAWTDALTHSLMRQLNKHGHGNRMKVTV